MVGEPTLAHVVRTRLAATELGFWNDDDWVRTPRNARPHQKTRLQSRQSQAHPKRSKALGACH